MSRSTHPGELTWARHLAAELGWLGAWRLRRHLAGCGPCRAHADELARDRVAFDASPERAGELARLQARAAGDSRRLASRGRRPGWTLGAVGGLAAAVAVWVAVRVPAPVEGLAEKGGSALSLYVDRPGGAVALAARCAPGDRLMARYRTDRAYLLLLQRDGAGTVQVLLPPGGTSSQRLAAGVGSTPHGLVLDAIPGRECFAAFFSDQPLDAAVAGQALDGLPTPPVLPGAAVRIQCCEKDGTR